MLLAEDEHGYERAEKLVFFEPNGHADFRVVGRIHYETNLVLKIVG